MPLVAGVGAMLAGCPIMLSPDDPLDPATLAALEEADCDTVTLTYDNFAKDFCARYCLSCHSVNLVGDAARTDAPAGIDFDTIEGIRSFATRIRLRAGELGDMPPRILGGDLPSHEDRIKLIQWLDCGTAE
jgi:uncharacterized membrane protein